MSHFDLIESTNECAVCSLLFTKYSSICTHLNWNNIKVLKLKDKVFWYIETVNLQILLEKEIKIYAHLRICCARIARTSWTQTTDE
jgi:hypothetical protein